MYHPLFKFILLFAMIGQFAFGQVKNGEYLEVIDSIRIHFVIKGKGPVLLAGHPTSGKVTIPDVAAAFGRKIHGGLLRFAGVGKSEAHGSIDGYLDEHLLDESTSH